MINLVRKFSSTTKKKQVLEIVLNAYMERKKEILEKIEKGFHSKNSTARKPCISDTGRRAAININASLVY